MGPRAPYTFVSKIICGIFDYLDHPKNTSGSCRQLFGKREEKNELFSVAYPSRAALVQKVRSKVWR